MPDPNPNPNPNPTPEVRDPAPAPAPNPAPNPAPAPAPAPAGTPNALDDANPNPNPAPNPQPVAGFADDWREKLVGDVTTEEGKKALAQLQRLASPKAMYDKLINQEKLISSGAYKKKLPDNATPEEIAEYRKENGLPESHDKYDLTLSDGMVIGEDDKPLVDNFVKAMFEKNAPQEVVTAALNTYMTMVQEQEAERATKDKEARDTTIAAMRAEWGQDYQPNLNLVKAFVSQAPAAVQEGLMNARLLDGTPLFSNPDVLRWLSGAARELNPVATVVPGSADPSSTIQTELANLKKLMGDDNSEYWKGPNAESNQKRYRELLGAQQRYKA